MSLIHVATGIIFGVLSIVSTVNAAEMRVRVNQPSSLKQLTEVKRTLQSKLSQDGMIWIQRLADQEAILAVDSSLSKAELQNALQSVGNQLSVKLSLLDVDGETKRQ
jgi:hypothetical protein